MRDRIWIPGHVLYEYKKNRIDVIKQLNRKWYANPTFFKDKYLHHLNDFVKNIEEQEYYHPYFDDKELISFKQNVEEVSKLIDSIGRTVKEQFKKRKDEILALQQSDNILKEILTLPTGVEFSFQEKIKIIKEGEWRYRQEIPPGYMDYLGKHGVQKYGDLIIWKELLNKATAENRSIIFITNDTKQDWYEEHDKQKEPMCPRHELILEFRESSGKDIWLYTLNQFVEKLEAIYKDDTSIPFYAGLDAVREVLAHMKRQKELEEKRRKAKYVRIICNNCDNHFIVDKNDFCFDWDLVCIDERGMGPERGYECTEYFECPECGNECSATFHVWEYPEEVFNYSEIVTDGCELEDDIDLSEHISFQPTESCDICGSWASLDEDGLCPECADRKRRFFEEDD